jgi:hypothetical protein
MYDVSNTNTDNSTALFHVIAIASQDTVCFTDFCTSLALDHVDVASVYAVEDKNRSIPTDTFDASSPMVVLDVRDQRNNDFNHSIVSNSAFFALGCEYTITFNLLVDGVDFVI